MKYFPVALLLILALGSVSIAQDEAVFSGPQVGEMVPGFRMKQGIGDSVGKEIDLVEMAGENPLVVIFMHKRSRPAFALANAVMKYCKKNGGDSLTCGTCMLTADPTDTQKWLGQVGKHFPEGIPVGYSTEGIEGPGAYGLNRNVQVTIVIGKQKKVTANFALVQPGAHADGPAILQAVAKATGSTKKIDINDYLPTNQGAQDAPIAIDPRLRKQIGVLANKESSEEAISEAIQAIQSLTMGKKPLQNQLGLLVRPWIRNGKVDSIGNAEQQAIIKRWAKNFGRPMNRGAGGRDRMAQRRDQPFPKLSNLLRGVIQKTASDDEVDQAASKVEAFIENKPGAKKELGRISNRVVNSGKLENYGTPHAQEILKDWAKKYPVDK